MRIALVGADGRMGRAIVRLAVGEGFTLAGAVVRESSAALAGARGVLGPSITGSYVEAPQGGANNETISQRLTRLKLRSSAQASASASWCTRVAVDG